MISHLQSPISSYQLRPDLARIAALIPARARVLDLGCGDGELLEHLVQAQHVTGRGIEISEAGVLGCVRRGLSVRQGNLQEGLADYPDASFDYVILSQTLPFLDDPAMILAEMLRVGERAIVSFPNWGYWRCRLHLLLRGEMPSGPGLSESWHSAPRWQAFTITDFAHFCEEIGIRIEQQLYLSGTRQMSIVRGKNLRAATAIFVLTR